MPVALSDKRHLASISYKALVTTAKQELTAFGPYTSPSTGWPPKSWAWHAPPWIKTPNIYKIKFHPVYTVSYQHDIMTIQQAFETTIKIYMMMWWQLPARPPVSPPPPLVAFAPWCLADCQCRCRGYSFFHQKRRTYHAFFQRHRAWIYSRYSILTEI